MSIEDSDTSQCLQLLEHHIVAKDKIISPR